MSNRGGVDAKFGGAGSQATGGMGLGGSPRQESSGGALGPVTRGWRKRGLAAYRRTRKANRLAKPAKAPAVNPAPRVRPPAKPKPDWLDTLTEDQVNKLVNSQAYSKYHPAFAEIASQKRQLAAQKQRNDDWFRQYQQQIGQASLNNAYVYGGAAGIVQQGAQAQAGQDEANRQALAQQQMADAQNRGVAYSPANDVTAQQAASSRLGSQNSFAALLAQQGAGDVARLQQQSGVVVPLQQRESQAASDAQLRALGAKALDLLKEKGDYRVQLKDTKRENERRRQLEMKTFGLKTQAELADEQVAAARLAVQQAKNAQDLRLAKEKLRIAQQNADANTTRANKPTAGSTTKSKNGLTPSKINGNKVAWRKAQSLLAGYRVSRDGKAFLTSSGKRVDQTTVRNSLVGTGVDSLIAQAAIYTKIYGGGNDAFRGRVFSATGLTIPKMSRTAGQGISDVARNAF